jgi:hypothetical protein
MAGATKRRLSGEEKRARWERAFENICLGMREAEIAAREGLTPRRVRQIVGEARREWLKDRTADFAVCETDWLSELLERAGRLVKTADSATILLLARVVDRLDRLAPAARANGA